MAKNENRSDKDLVLAYKSTGDLNVLAILFERYMSLVFTICLKYSNDEPSARDRTMEVFELMIEKVKKYEIKNFKGWLYSVTRNHCLEFFRKENKMKTQDINPGHVYSNTVFHLDIDDVKESRLNQLEHCLKLLNEMQQKCVRMFYLDNHSYQEISTKLKLSWSEVRSFIQNGRRNLKKCMKADHEF